MTLPNRSVPHPIGSVDRVGAVRAERPTLARTAPTDGSSLPFDGQRVRQQFWDDRGMKVIRSKQDSTRPKIAAVAMVRTIAMAMQHPPPSFR